MPKVNIGDRVGAVCSYNTEAKEMLIFGYGIYQGDEIPGKEIVGPFGITPQDLQMKNPKILLDSGEVVWGCECWWAAEEYIKDMIKQDVVKLRYITTEQYRKDVAEALESNSTDSPEEVEDNT